MSKQTVVLTKFLRIGDRVEMQMGKEARDWGRKGVADGTLGTVVGFNRYKDAVGRNDRWLGRATGIYEGNGAAYVLWDNGEHCASGGEDICFVDESLNESRRTETKYWDAFEARIRISDLPVLPFYEGDVVLMKRREGRLITDNPTLYKGTISRVDYLRIGQKRDDGSDLSVYIFYSEEGWTTYVSEQELTLVERGNYWRYENEPETLKFIDLKAEAAFYKSLGFAEQVKNPKSSDYGWTVEEAFAAIYDGTADIVSVQNGYFGGAPFPVVYRFPEMRELGERLRQEALKQNPVA